MVTEPACFEFCEASIGSSIELPELPRTSAPPKIRFRLKPGPTQTASEWELIHEWSSPGGRTAFSCFKGEGGYRLRFSDGTDFEITADASSIEARADEGVPRESIRQKLLAQVLPRALSQRGHPVLHASAVATPWGAVALLGPTGAGKSTLAASFANPDDSWVADDCLVVDEAPEGLRAVPTLRGLRLRPDSAAALVASEGLAALPREIGGKVWLPKPADTENLRPRVHRLKASFVLHPREDSSSVSATVERLSPAEAVMSFVEHSFQLDITDSSVQKRRLETFSRFADQLPTYRLEYRQEFALLDSVRQTILTHLVESR